MTRTTDKAPRCKARLRIFLFSLSFCLDLRSPDLRSPILCSRTLDDFGFVPKRSFSKTTRTSCDEERWAVPCCCCFQVWNHWQWEEEGLLHHDNHTTTLPSPYPEPHFLSHSSTWICLQEASVCDSTRSLWHLETESPLHYYYYYFFFYWKQWRRDDE